MGDATIVPGAPFDGMADSYDAGFTNTTIGRMMRGAVWRRLDERIGPGDRVLELGCGTGEDAVHLALRGARVLATDASSLMAEYTARKAESRGVSASVSTRILPMEELLRLAAEGPFDGILSDFGGMNCVAHLRELAPGMAELLRPGGVVFLCVMGPVVPWEWAWYLGHGRPGKAFRRLRPGGVPWQGLTVRYPSIGRLRRAFAPFFRLDSVSAIGAFIPPPYAEKWAARHRRLVAILNRLERELETVWPLPWLADHYLVELVRR